MIQYGPLDRELQLCNDRVVVSAAQRLDKTCATGKKGESKIWRD